MNHPTLSSSIFMIAMLAGSAAYAGKDIVKCVDQNGKVTLTDAQCGAGVKTVLVPAGAEAAATAPASTEDEAGDAAIDAAAPVARRAPSQRVAYSPQPIQHDNWTVPPSRKTLSRDVETLKAARLSMRVLDEASANVRQQRLAGLN